MIEGDITAFGAQGMLEVDAIVNSSNVDLSPEGGLDWIIHQKAGPKLLKECKKIGGCPTGEARVTKGYKLPVKWIIHTAGPIVWEDLGLRELEKNQLRSCYLSILKIAQDKDLKTIAMPAISTGAFGFPKKEAAEIAVKTIKEFVAMNPTQLAQVYLVAYDPETAKIYEDILGVKSAEVDSLIAEETGPLVSLKKIINW